MLVTNVVRKIIDPDSKKSFPKKQIYIDEDKKTKEDRSYDDDSLYDDYGYYYYYDYSHDDPVQDDWFDATQGFTDVEKESLAFVVF